MEARTLLALAAILAVASTAAATTHIVGGATGWTIPPNATFYSVWASSQVITPGDSLVFNFAKGAHDVAKVPKASYDACTTTSQLGSTLNNAPATVTVAAGTHYYICAVPGHCSAGQKLAVTVAKGPAVSAPAPAVAPSVAPKASPVPAAAPGVAVPTASTPSLSPAAATAAGSTADAPTAAAGPSSGSNSATELRSAAGAAVAVLAVAAASLLI